MASSLVRTGFVRGSMTQGNGCYQHRCINNSLEVCFKVHFSNAFDELKMDVMKYWDFIFVVSFFNVNLGVFFVGCCRWHLESMPRSWWNGSVSWL